MTLLERGTELDVLEALLERAASAEGHLVLLGGEAGVGKTALVNHLSERARETARVLVGACDPLSTPRPLGPLLDIAHDAGGELAPLVATDAPRHLLFHATLDALKAPHPPSLSSKTRIGQTRRRWICCASSVGGSVERDLWSSSPTAMTRWDRRTPCGSSRETLPPRPPSTA